MGTARAFPGQICHPAQLRQSGFWSADTDARGDVQIAADNAVFGQTGPKVGSFDAGYGSTAMARIIGTKAPSPPPPPPRFGFVQAGRGSS